MNYVPDTYSQIILGLTSKENLLLLHPINLDKENIILSIIGHYSRKFSEKRIAIIIPKSSLKSYYENYFKNKEFAEKEIYFPTSLESTEKRKRSYAQKRIVVITPHLFHNDLLRKNLNSNDFGFLIFDHAHTIKGKHASVKLLEVFYQTNPFIKIVGFTAYPFTQAEEIAEICSHLLITKIEFCKSSNPMIQNSLLKSHEKHIVVPLNKSIYNLVYDLNRTLKEYETLFKKKLHLNPFTIKSKIKNISEKLHLEYGYTEADGYIQKMVEYINIQNIKELLEVFGLRAAKQYILFQRKKVLEGNCSAYLYEWRQKFVNSRLIKDLISEIEFLETQTEHPKISRFIQLISNLREKKGYSRFLVIVNNKTIANILPIRIATLGLSNRFMSSNYSKKEKEKLIQDYNSGKLNVLIVTKKINVESDVEIYFNVPKRVTWFTERKENEGERYIFITHRTLEEKILYKYLSREKNFEKISLQLNVQKVLARNQQKLFNNKISERMNNRTKAMLNVVRTFSKNQQQSDSKTMKKFDDGYNDSIVYIQFLSNCTREEAQKISSYFPNEESLNPQSLNLDMLESLFIKPRADELYQAVKGRLDLVSD